MMHARSCKVQAEQLRLLQAYRGNSNSLLGRSQMPCLGALEGRTEQFDQCVRKVRHPPDVGIRGL